MESFIATLMMKHFRPLFLWLLLVTCCFADRPNVIIFLTDDQSWDSIGYMGGKVHTPKIDQLAKRGMIFNNFNVTSTVCSPSRYSFLTGRFAGNCKGKRFMQIHPPGDQTQIENIGELETDSPNLAKVLQDNGYRTGFIGKSHVVRHDLIAHTPKHMDKRFKKVANDADLKDPEVSAKLKHNHEVWKELIKSYGFDYADGIYPANTREYWCEAINNHNLDWTVSKAMDFLDSNEDEQPFFLYFSTTLHHGPAPWNNKFSLDADPKFTPEGYFPEGFDVLPPRDDVKARNRKAGFKNNQAFALWLDDGVGAIHQKCVDLGIDKNTIFMFVSDHGSYRHGKATLHDYGMKVPMFIHWPQHIKPGCSNDSLLANIDIAPTLFEVCSIPQQNNYPVDGLSFAETIRDNSQKEYRQALFGELGHSRCIKTKQWKYIAVRYPEKIQAQIDKGKTFKSFKGDKMLDRPYLTRNEHLGHYASAANPNYFDPDQLYNLKKDPEELNNVFENFPEKTTEMKALLAKELQGFSDRPFGEFTK